MGTGFELGNIYVTVDIDYKVWPAEPMVMYYPDGSGYPGDPAELEILDVIVTSISGETYDLDYRHLGKTGWFKDLNRLAFEFVEENVYANGWVVEEISELENAREW